MEGCLKSDCPASCCRRRKIHDIAGQIKRFVVFVYGDEEIAELEKQNGPLADLNIEKRNIFLPTQGDRPGEAVPQKLVAIDHCFEESGKCKLKEKPFECRVYPFYLDSGRAINPFCPQAEEIFRSQQNIRKIISLRVLHGMHDHDEWLENGEIVLSTIFRKIQQGRLAQAK